MKDPVPSSGRTPDSNRPVRTKIRAVCTACLLLLLLGGATEPVSAQEPKIAVDLDHAAFAYGDSTSLLELYFAFGARTLPFSPDSSGYYASVPIRAQLAPEGDPSRPVWADSVDLRFSVADTAALQSEQMFLHQLRVSVAPGTYVLTVEPLTESPAARSMRSFERDVSVPDFAAGTDPRFSDVSLASRIDQSTNQSSPFYKNGLLIRPNPRRVYGPGLNRLYYYTELYRPGSPAAVDDQYRFRSYIAREDRGAPVQGLERTVARDVRSPDVLVGRFDVSTLPSGSYRLYTELRDGNDSVAVTQERKFFIYNPDQPGGMERPAEGPEVSPRYRSMDEQMVDAAVGAVGEIASDGERELIQQLEGLQEKKVFLTRFWNRRDQTPQTAANEREDAFYRNLRVVREQYGTPFSEPWETDRGRVMLEYGRPDQIDPHLHERETRPYTVWQYDHVEGDGQVMFIFIDREGFGEFDLVHSTATGEVKNPDWRRLIQ